MIPVNESRCQAFRTFLEENERCRATVEKYLRDVRQLAVFCGGQLREKSQLIAFKQALQERGYAASSVNSMLAAVNCFLNFSGRPEWKLRLLKIQRSTFVDQGRELDPGEYERLVRAARRRKDRRMALLLQAIQATGIRVSELKAITVESLRAGQTRIQSKGKNRLILLPARLCRELLRYCREQGRRSGCVFVTKTGRPLDRSYIWKRMKRLAQEAGVELRKAFPHNLRHLFARSYYRRYKDIVHLADILGHSSVNTTRIYTAKSGGEQRRQLDALYQPL